MNKYPGIIRRLFENEGAGDKLNPDILPFGDGKERDPEKTPATLADLSEVKDRVESLETAGTGRDEAIYAAITEAVSAETQARGEAMTSHDANPSAHDALVKRITVGSQSPVIGICCVEDGGGSGLWFTIDAEGQPVSPSRSYFDYHPTYNAMRRVLMDGQMMQEHHKFYYKALEIASGPFAGCRGRLISPGQIDGFKPFPSFMKNGQEIDTWYCGTFSGTNEGGTPIKIGSRPGKVPLVNVNFPTMQGYCQNRNVDGVTGFDMWNIYQAAEIQLLALIEAGSSDTQAVYGQGRVNASSAANVDATDVATATWRGHVGLWGNVWQMCAGLEVTTSGTVRLWKNDGSQEWVDTGFVCPAYNGSNPAYMVKLKTGSGEGFDFEDIFFPETTSTSATAGTIPDGFWGRYGSAGNVLYLGAYWAHGVRAGLFACTLSHAASHANTNIGCRLAICARSRFFMESRTARNLGLAFPSGQKNRRNTNRAGAASSPCGRTWPRLSKSVRYGATGKAYLAGACELWQSLGGVAQGSAWQTLSPSCSALPCRTRRQSA